jgi:pheromone receptor transcription factor
MSTAEVTTVRKASRGRQAIAIQPIENRDRRQVTFSKRKSGIFKKGSELTLLCDAKVAIIIFSNSGKPYAMGSPSVDEVLRLAAPLPGGGDDRAPALLPAVPDRAAVEATVRQLEQTTALVAAEKLRMRAIGDRVVQAAKGRRFWWEADVEMLGAAELPEFARALQRLRHNLRHHIEKLLGKQ